MLLMPHKGSCRRSDKMFFQAKRETKAGGEMGTLTVLFRFIGTQCLNTERMADWIHLNNELLSCLTGAKPENEWFVGMRSMFTNSSTSVQVDI